MGKDRSVVHYNWHILFSFSSANRREEEYLCVIDFVNAFTAYQILMHTFVAFCFNCPQPRLIQNNQNSVWLQMLSHISSICFCQLLTGIHICLRELDRLSPFFFSLALPLIYFCIYACTFIQIFIPLRTYLALR